VTLGGLKINDTLQVLDTQLNVIPGLYAAGNTSGCFFGGDEYPTTIPGLTHSRAWTFGRLAGLSAAAEKTGGV
jgi:fumarate reductase flavoprotein subunit